MRIFCVEIILRASPQILAELFVCIPIFVTFTQFMKNWKINPHCSWIFSIIPMVFEKMGKIKCSSVFLGKFELECGIEFHAGKKTKTVLEFLLIFFIFLSLQFELSKCIFLWIFEISLDKKYKHKTKRKVRKRVTIIG